MNLQTVFLYGRAGAGKGTQAAELNTFLREQDPDRKTIYLETGQRFRDFIQNSKTYTRDRVKQVLDEGGLLPAFLPIWIWTSLLNDEVTGNDHLVLDGLCRRPEEAPILDSAMKFYGRHGATVIVLDITDEEAMTRLLKRARHDDHDEKIKERLGWFQTDVVPTMEFFKNDPFYNFITINGMQSIEDVHKDILKALKLA